MAEKDTLSAMGDVLGTAVEGAKAAWNNPGAFFKGLVTGGDPEAGAAYDRIGNAMRSVMGPEDSGTIKTDIKARSSFSNAAAYVPATPEPTHSGPAPQRPAVSQGHRKP